jgi:hypothetical protein
MELTINWLIQKGLHVQNITNMTVSFAGKKNKLEEVFSVLLTKKNKKIDTYYGGELKVEYWLSDKPLWTCTNKTKIKMQLCFTNRGHQAFYV